MSRQINCFGFEQPYYRKTFSEIEPYQFEKSGANIYVRFDATTGDCPIVKINKDSDTYTQTWGYGKWENRAILDNYIPINEQRVVED